MKLSPLLILVAAFLMGLLTTFVVDPLDKTTVSTPFLLGIILMGLSLRQSTFLVSVVSLFYCFLTVFALVQFHRYYAAYVHASPHPYFWLFQRVGLFLVLCGLSIYLAHYRTDTERILTRLRTILSKLPVPVILSNASGSIVYANDAITEVLHLTPSEVTGKNYFDYFHTESKKGKSIRSYFELFETDASGIYELNVGPLNSSRAMKAQLNCLGTGPNRVLITVLQNFEKTHPVPSLT